MLIDVDGMILNARGSALFGSTDNPVALFRERLKLTTTERRAHA